MAQYWAYKPSLPHLGPQEFVSAEYICLQRLSESAKGLSLDEGQVDILGAIEMLCALQYHHQNFLGILRKKALGEIDLEAPDDRFEAVAYLSRAGQFYYFSNSPFVIGNLGKRGDCYISSIRRLLPFRHKYAAHRERDNPRPGEEMELSGELALGSIGGKLFTAPGGIYPNNSVHKSYKDEMQDKYANWWVTFQISSPEGGAIYFTPQKDHPRIIQEATRLIQDLIPPKNS